MGFHFSMNPRDVEQLTIGEFELFAIAIEEMRKQTDKRDLAAKRPSRKR